MKPPVKEHHMAMHFAEPAPPSEDKRWRIVMGTMRRHGYAPHALIETLHTAQQSFGFLDETALRYVAAGLRVPLSKAYGVATFYHLFTLKPPGKHTCVVCLGTACYIKGAAKLLDAVEQTTHLKPGETTPQGEVSLLTARCLGSCSLAPVAVLDGQIIGEMDAAGLNNRVQEWMSHDA
jgi:bidirectional [NiFe] hydrogenase diaphorase subunit